MLVAFTIIPLIYNIWLSFHEYSTFARQLRWVGGANWVQLVADSRMWEALGITLFYFVVTLTVEVILGMAIALLLDRFSFADIACDSGILKQIVSAEG